MSQKFLSSTTGHSLRRSLRRSLLGVLVMSSALSANAAVNKKPLVFVRNAEVTEVAEQLTYPARIEPRIQASIIADTDGIVSEIRAPLGSQVKKRTSILVIRNTDPVYQYSPMVVTSPVSGIVSRIEVTEGSRVSRGDKLALVTDPAQARVVVEVTAQDLAHIHPGLEATLLVPGRPDEKPVKLKVRGISPFVDPATGTASCELEVADKNKLPPPGVIARVNFRANVRKGINLPDTVLTYRGEVPFVRTIVDGKAKFTEVKIGRKQSGSVEILQGLKPGDQVIERSSAFVAEGEVVEIKARDGGGSKPASQPGAAPASQPASQPAEKPKAEKAESSQAPPSKKG